MGDRANKFIGLLSERYTGLSPESRARYAAGREGRKGRRKESGHERGRLSRGSARKIVKTLYNSAEKEDIQGTWTAVRAAERETAERSAGRQKEEG